MNSKNIFALQSIQERADVKMGALGQRGAKAKLYWTALSNFGGKSILNIFAASNTETSEALRIRIQIIWLDPADELR